MSNCIVASIKRSIYLVAGMLFACHTERGYIFSFSFRQSVEPPTNEMAAGEAVLATSGVLHHNLYSNYIQSLHCAAHICMYLTLNMRSAFISIGLGALTRPVIISLLM